MRPFKKKSKKSSVYVDPGASVPIPQDTSVQDTFPNRLLPIVLLCGLLSLLFVFCGVFLTNPIFTNFDRGLWDGVKRSWLVVPQTGPERASLKMSGSSLPWGCFNDISDGSPRAGAGEYRE